MKEIRSNEIISQLTEESRLVEGYAVVFNSRSIDLGGFYEVIDKNALDGVLERSDVVALLDHDKQRGILARARSNKERNSLNLTVDDKGLAFSFEAPKTALGDEILEGVRRGDITSCSFAFTVKEDEFRKEPDGTILRTIKQIDKLYDISLVYNPCYDDTSVDTRGLKEFLDNSNDSDMNEEVRSLEESKEEKVITEEVQEQEEASVEEEVKEIEEKSECGEPDKEEKSEPEEEPEVKEEDEQAEDKEDDEPVKEDEERSQVSETNQETRNSKTNLTKPIMDKKFSLIQTINDVVNNRGFNDASADVIARSKENAVKNGVNFGSAQIVLSGINDMAVRGVANPNGILATEATYGNEAVPSEIFDITGKLRDKMVLAQAGARFVNATSNLDFVSYSGSTCGWGDEIEEAQDGSGKFSIKKLTPMRLCTVLPISKTFLAQADGSAEALLREDLVNAVAETLQKTILGAGAGSANEPAGLMNGVNQDAAAFDYAEAVNVEALLESKNFNTDGARWIVAPSSKALLRNTKVDAGSGRFVMENNEILGVPAFSTSSMVEGGVIYGDFSELIIANWDSMSILVDPYTLAAKNQIRLVVNYYVNYILRREDALVKRVIKG